MSDERHNGMLLDVRGRIENTTLPPTHAALSVFEAVVNSIHAIEDRFGDAAAERGQITVTVFREELLDLDISKGRPRVREISSISVNDNGVGFTDENFDAFMTADTRAKAGRGGKGIGRFTWLVVFERAEIQSVYMNGKSPRQRTFSFKKTKAAIEKLGDHPASPEENIGSSITLHTVNRVLKNGRDK